jgi:4-amino-4-deoxy-L-arabinose transferase-like glycosyltransferase
LDSTKKYHKTVATNLSKIYRDPLFILTIITAGITFYLLMVQMKIGVPYWDVFNYLNNALYFAGAGNSSFIYLPPLIPALTSIFFKIGYTSINAIFMVDSIIFIIGVIGLYLLLNQRFNKIQSFTGSLIYLSFPIVLAWAATGGIDIPGVSFSIWAIYFTVLGVKKDSRFLYFVIPIIMLAFLARYTAGLIILPVFFYSFINIKQIQKIKKVILGIILEIISLLAIFILVYAKLGTIKSVYNLLLNVSTFTYMGVTDVAYNPDKLYYLKNIFNYISVGPFQGTYQQILSPSNGFPSILSYAIALIVIIGIIFYIYRILNVKINNTNNLNLNSLNLIKITLIIVLIISFIIAFNSMPYIISEVIFFAICCLLYVFLKNPKTRNLDLDLMFLSWFGAYLIFQSILTIKVDRYFTTMTPALAFFLILGLSEFIDKIKPKIKNSSLRSWGVYSIIGLIFLSSAAVTYIGHAPKKCFTADIGDASSWINGYDSNYQDKKIYSDYPPAASWYLKKEVKGAYPRFFNNTKGFSNWLQKNGVYYYIDSLSEPKPNLEGYHTIKTIGNIAIYEKS